MAGKRSRIPKYGTVEINGHTYYRTNITDSEGKQRTLYAKTREELYDKELDTLSQMDDDRQRRKSPTVADYCEKWLVMQSAHVRTTTLTDYKSKVRRNIIPYWAEKIPISIDIPTFLRMSQLDLARALTENIVKNGYFQDIATGRNAALITGRSSSGLLYLIFA